MGCAVSALLLVFVVVFTLVWALASAGRGLARRLGVAKGTNTKQASFETGGFRFEDTKYSADGVFLAGIANGPNRGGELGACAMVEAASKKLLFCRRIVWGNEFYVGNNGFVVVEDVYMDTFTSAVLCFDRVGNQLWRKRFKGEIAAMGLSDDGLRAFVSGERVSRTRQRCTTLLLDVLTGKALWEVDALDGVAFVGNLLVSRVEASDGTMVDFPVEPCGSLSPACLLAHRTMVGASERGRASAVLPKLQAALKALPPDLATIKQRLSELNGPHAEVAEADRALLLRVQGEVAEAEGDIGAAIEFWRQALELQPKVGIRRRYEALLKKVG